MKGIALGLLIWCAASVPTALVCGALLRLSSRRDGQATRRAATNPAARTDAPAREVRVRVVGNPSA